MKTLQRSALLLVASFVVLCVLLPSVGMAATRAQQDAWFATAEGKYIDVDGYPSWGVYQCVDVAFDYCNALWDPISYADTIGSGDAGQPLFDAAKPEYFTKIAYDDPNLIPQHGDIVFWDSGTTKHIGVTKKHVAVVDTADANGMTVLEQNYGSPDGTVPCDRRLQTYTDVIGWLRPILRQSVGLVPNASGLFGGAGVMPTSGGGFDQFQFSNLAPSSISAASLAALDTLVFIQVGDTATRFTQVQKAEINSWVSAGGKLIIYDSDACPAQDYSWLTYHFETDNPGQLGASGGTLEVVEDNTLSSSDPASPYYVDTSAIATGTDAVGDANVITSKDSHWYGDMEATNAHKVTGWVHAYATPGSGLVIYNGLDSDNIGSSAGLQKLWLFELSQPCNPDGLPHSTRVRGGSGPPVVVLLTGLGSSTMDGNGGLDTWQYVSVKLWAAGYPSWRAKEWPGANNWDEIDTTSADWDRAAESLDHQLSGDKTVAGRRIILVGHSMGGLIARAYVDMWYKNGKRMPSGCTPLGIVQMATPNGGSPGGNIAWGASWFKSQAAHRLADPSFMSTFNTTHVNKARLPIYRLAGTYAPNTVARDYPFLLGADPIWLSLVGLYVGRLNDAAVDLRSVMDGPAYGWTGSPAGFDALHPAGPASGHWPMAGHMLPVLPAWQKDPTAIDRDRRIVDAIVADVGKIDGNGGKEWMCVRAGGGWSPAKGLASLESTASVESRLDAASGDSTVLSRSVSLSGGTSRSSFVTEGSSVTLLASPDQGEVSVRLESQAGLAVAVESSTQAGDVTASATGLTPGATYVAVIEATSGSPTQAQLAILDNGPSALRLVAPPQVGGGDAFSLYAAVYEMGLSGAAPTFSRSTSATRLDARLDAGLPVTLHDDGVTPDEIAGDGIYSVSLNAPLTGESASIELEAFGRDSSGIASQRVAAASVTIAEPRASLTGEYASRTETDASGMITALLIDVGVAAHADCALTVDGDMTAGGTLAGQGSESTTLLSGQTATVTLRIPASNLYPDLSGVGEYEVSRIGLTDRTDSYSALLDQAENVLSGTLDPRQLSYAQCSAGLLGSNPSASSEVTVEGVAACTFTPVTGVQYMVDGSDIWVSVSSPAGGWGSGLSSWSATVNLPDDYHELQFRAVGASGPISGAESTLTFSIDTVSPETTADAPSAWVGSSPVAVKLSAFDATSGIDHTEYRLAATLDWLTYSEQITVANEGTTTYEFRSVDFAGNVEPTQRFTVRLDTRPPEGVFALAGGAASTSARDITVDSSVTDVGSGVVDMRFSADGGTTWSDWQPYAATSGLTLPDSYGSRTVTAQYRDAAGNVLELSDSIELVASAADTTPPTTTATGADALWHNAPVTVAFAAADEPGGSGMSGGLAKTEYKLGAGTWTSGTSITVPAPADHSGDGEHTLAYRSTDAAGNLEAARSLTVKIDTTAPSGNFALNAGAATTASRSVSGDSAVSDAHGPLEMRFSLNAKASWSSWEAYAAAKPLTLPAGLGSKSVVAQYRDAAGNVLELSDAIVLIALSADTTPPTTSASGADARWHNAPVTVTFAATDEPGGSGMSGGLAKTEYKLDAGEWTTGTSVTVPAPADHSGDGEHTLAYRSTDAAGNLEAARSVTVKIDTTAPNGSFALNAGAATTASRSVSGDSAVSDAYGPLEMRFSLNAKADWSSWEAYAATRSLTLRAGLGSRSVVAQYRDAAGNVLELSDAIALVALPVVDSTPPVTMVHGVDSAWHASSVAVTFTAEDLAPNASGVAYTEYKLDDGTWIHGTAVTVPAPPETRAAHSILYRSADVAGNLEAARSCTVKIDTRTETPPPEPELTYTITPVALGGHGSISPDGPQSIAAGGSMTFAFAPEAGYHVGTVTVDGTVVSLTAANQYTFTGVSADHTISVSFAAAAPLASFTITPIVNGGHGTVTPASPLSVVLGATPTFTFMPEAGYDIVDVSVDGVRVALTATNAYTFAPVTADHTLTVAFSSGSPLPPDPGPITMAAPAPAAVKHGKVVALRYRVNEAVMGGFADVTITIKNPAGKVVARKAAKAVLMNSAHSLSFTCNLPKGTYRFHVSATTAAGARSANTASNTLTVR